MTCITSNLSSLRWFIDDMVKYTYVYSTGDESKLPIMLSTLPLGIVVNITSITPIDINFDSYNATSTLTTNTTFLQAFNMQDFTCGTVGTMSAPVTVNFEILGELIIQYCM